METVSEHIDFSGNEELWKETNRMVGLGQSILAEGIGQGTEKGIEQGIRAMILDNQEEKVPRDRILGKLQKRFSLTREKAEYYFDKFSEEV